MLERPNTITRISWLLTRHTDQNLHIKVKEKRFLEQEREVFTSLTVWGHSHPSQ